ncbi:hypothetical protein B0H11DRAFT_1937904 [Mycena galericulata]|nr:hypothetical protein B0H11DRAFT_1937904 [Mycena galericulata]
MSEFTILTQAQLESVQLQIQFEPVELKYMHLVCFNSELSTEVGPGSNSIYIDIFVNLKLALYTLRLQVLQIPRPNCLNVIARVRLESAIRLVLYECYYCGGVNKIRTLASSVMSSCGAETGSDSHKLEPGMSFHRIVRKVPVPDTRHAVVLKFTGWRAQVRAMTFSCVLWGIPGEEPAAHGCSSCFRQHTQSSAKAHRKKRMGMPNMIACGVLHSSVQDSESQASDNSTKDNESPVDPNPTLGEDCDQEGRYEYVEPGGRLPAPRYSGIGEGDHVGCLQDQYNTFCAPLDEDERFEGEVVGASIKIDGVCSTSGCAWMISVGRIKDLATTTRVKKVPESISDQEDDDYEIPDLIDASDSEASDDEMEIDNKEIASLLTSKTVPRRSTSTKSKPQTRAKTTSVMSSVRPLRKWRMKMIPRRNTAPATKKSRRATVEEVEDEDDSPKVISTRNPIYLFFESVNQNSVGYAGSPGDKHYKCFHGNREIITISKASNSNVRSECYLIAPLTY